MGIPGRRRQATGAGFTLVELVLTVALLLLFVGAAVFNFSSAQRGSQLDEGAGQLESLFRYARAQAASTGRLVRVSFGGDAEVATGGTNSAMPLTAGIQVSWEPDPLGAPGRFQSLREAASFTDRLNEMVQFRPVLAVNFGLDGLATTNTAESSLSLAGGETSAAAPMADEADLTHPLPIAFYPDGSSDSRELILVSLDQEDRRQLQLTLTGITGTVRRKWLTVDGQGEVTDPAEPNFSEPAAASAVSSTSSSTPTK
jgi:Tfp pilus assembly protein FimT